MLKKPYFNLFGKKVLTFLSLWPLNQLLNLGFIFLHLYFSLNFGTCLDHSILDKNVSVIFKKIFDFNFICVLVFFQKYSMTSVYKNPKIYVNIHYFANRGHNLLCC